MDRIQPNNRYVAEGLRRRPLSIQRKAQLKLNVF